MISPATDPARAHGLDVSAWQNWDAADWRAAAKAGYRFAAIKASECGVEDKRFAEHWRNARDAGFLRIAYSFVHAAHAILPQADKLLELLAREGHGELPPAADMERNEDDDRAHLSASQITDAVCEWMDIVHPALERRPLLYTGADFSKHRLVGERLAECSLWGAQYGVTVPDFSHAWKRWDIWQHTGKGAIPGVPGRVDLNVYNGTLADLRDAYGVTP